MKKKNAKKRQEKGFRNLLKNNVISVIVLVLLISIVGVFAGNVYVTNGDLDVDENFTVDTNTFFVDSTNNRIGIGTNNPVLSFQVSKTNYATWGIPSMGVAHSTNAFVFLVADATDHNLFVWDSNRNLHFATAGSTIADPDSDLSKKMTITSSGKIGIGTTTPSYPLEVNGDVSGVSIYASGNVSATGYITRTSIFDKSKGSALDYIFSADDYVSNGEINHKKFYGYAGEFEVSDYSRPEIEEYDCESKEGICERIIYPYTKTEEGVLLDAEINVLRQAVYDLKTELCSYNAEYSWC